MTAQAHGGLDAGELAALGLAAEHVLDFSASLNVYGPDPAVAAAARGADLLAYPDPTGAPARRAIADRFGVAADAVVVGNGAADLLWSFARALVGAGTSVVVEPAFSEWRAAVAASGGRVLPCPSPVSSAPDLVAIARVARDARAHAIYLGNPGNPSGIAVAIDDLAALARDLGRVPLVLDEAFLALSDRHGDLDRRLPDTVIRVRSLTKDHGLAGLRVGYALAPPALCRHVESQRPPWTTSAPAQAAMIAALGRDDFVAASRQRLFADRDRLASALVSVGLAPRPSSTIYLLAGVVAAGALRARLLAHHGIAVRDCTSFGLPDHVRVAARPAADVERLRSALAQELPCLREPS